MADDSVTGGWPGVSRDGQPELIRGQLPGSVRLQNKYKIRESLIGQCAFEKKPIEQKPIEKDKGQ